MTTNTEISLTWQERAAKAFETKEREAHLHVLKTQGPELLEMAARFELEGRPYFDTQLNRVVLEVDGVKFTRAEYDNLAVVIACPDCGAACRSRSIYDWSDLGAALEGKHGNDHYSCPKRILRPEEQLADAIDALLASRGYSQEQ